MILNIAMKEGDIIELYFRGGLLFSDGSVGVANMGLIPNCVSSFDFSRATFFETAGGTNNNVNLDSEISARFIRGETGYGTFSKATVYYLQKRIFVTSNFYSPTGSDTSRQGMISTYLGNFNTINNFKLVGTGKSQIDAESVLKIYKK